jgi:DNA-binding CsgD family transcriptional regulator
MTRTLKHVIDEPGFTARLNSDIAKIPQAVHASEVTSVVEDVVRTLGCNAAVFAAFSRDDDNFENYRYIAACPAQWCSSYISRRWFVIDPYLRYAQTHSEIIAADDVPLRTDGQRLFRLRAQEHGFRSIAIVPTHSASGRSRMGVLYMASEDAAYFTQSTVLLAKMFLRAIAAEILEWWARRIRSEIRLGLVIRGDELDLLRLVRQGFGTKEIARLYNVKPAAIDQRLARIALRLNAPSRGAAARIAYENGLLDD